MRRIILTEEQLGLIKSHNDGFVNDCRENGFKSLDDRAIDKLLKERHNEILSYFKDDVSGIPHGAVYNKLGRLIEKAKKIEEPIRDALVKLCLNTVIETFDIPDGEFTLNCELVDTIDSKKQFHVKPDTNEGYEYEDYSAITSEDDEIVKRKIINLLITGGARDMFAKCRSIYIDRLFELDEELPYLYSKIMKLNDLLLFMSNVRITDKVHMQCSYNELEINNTDKNVLNVYGTLFPFLLFETFKGIFELLAVQGLPEDIHTAKNVLNQCDVLCLDPTNMRLGVPLWKRLFSNVDIKHIPDIFHKVCKLKSDKIEDVFNNIAFNTRYGLKVVEDIKKRGGESYEKTRFDNDIIKRQSDTVMINDGYFLSEELRDC